MAQLDFSAIYGSFNLEMVPIKGIDVKQRIIERFMHEDRIIIPAGTDFNQYFTDPVFGMRKFLQIKTPERTHNIIEDNYNQDIIIPSGAVKKRVKLIYYIYINPNSNWRGIISGQLLQLKGYGILDEVDLYVHITDLTNNLATVVGFVKELVEGAVISTSTENHFEYPGIRLVYDLAHQDPECIFIYLHAKGMSYNVHSRRIDEITLLTNTFENWRKKLELFEDKHINKVGLFPAIGDDKDIEKQGTRGGWIWFNFWYARGSYLVNCDEPVHTQDRYFFEHWLGLQNGKLIINNDCYNLYRSAKKTYFTPSQAVRELDNLIDKKFRG